MRPVEFHTNVARLSDAERVLRQGERPAVQQTFAAEVQKTMAEREQQVQRNEETHAVHLDPKQRQQNQGKKKEEQQDDQDGNRKKRRRLDVRI